MLTRPVFRSVSARREPLLTNDCHSEQRAAVVCDADCHFYLYAFFRYAELLPLRSRRAHVCFGYLIENPTSTIIIRAVYCSVCIPSQLFAFGLETSQYTGT